MSLVFINVILIGTDTRRVNIDNLMSKVRANQKKQRKENLVFVGLIGSIVVISGIIASF